MRDFQCACVCPSPSGLFRPLVSSSVLGLWNFRARSSMGVGPVPRLCASSVSPSVHLMPPSDCVAQAPAFVGYGWLRCIAPAPSGLAFCVWSGPRRLRGFGPCAGARWVRGCCAPGTPQCCVVAVRLLLLIATVRHLFVLACQLRSGRPVPGWLVLALVRDFGLVAAPVGVPSPQHRVGVCSHGLLCGPLASGLGGGRSARADRWFSVGD